MTEFHKGDKVRVVIDGEVLAVGTGGWMNVAVGAVPGQPQRGVVSLPRSGEGVSVTVLERADDPTIGEIRAVAKSLDGEPKTAVKVGARLSMAPSERFLWVVVETGEVLADGDIDVQEVIGAVPGTQAAEAEKDGWATGLVGEPPEWVNEVVDRCGDRLRREGDGWIGVGGDGYPLNVKEWAGHVLPRYAPYTEVSS